MTAQQSKTVQFTAFQHNS